MPLDPAQESPTQDRRVLRSRAALLAAAVRLVSERGTTAIPVTDLAEAANVSRQLVYLQFGDREALLVAAAGDLVRRELTSQVGDSIEIGRPQALATAQHFARHRSFYRAMLTGSCAFAMTRTLNSAFSPFNRRAMRELFGDLDDDPVADLAAFFTGGTGAIINDWLIDGEDPLDPQELADRIIRVGSILTASQHVQAAKGRVR